MLRVKFVLTPVSTSGQRDQRAFVGSLALEEWILQGHEGGERGEPHLDEIMENYSDRLKGLSQTCLESWS